MSRRLRRPLTVALGLTTAVAVTAFASMPEWRQTAIAQLRAIAEPLFERGEATDPHFDAFYVGMVDALPVQQRAERALELAMNRYTGASEYIIEHAQEWSKDLQATARLNALVGTTFDDWAQAQTRRQREKGAA